MNARFGLALLAALVARPAAAQVVAAPGYAVRTIPTPATVQGGVVRRDGAILVGQGPTFTAGAQSIVRLVEGGGATTIATGFNSLGGIDLDAAGTLYVVDNCFAGNGDACGTTATGDSVYAIPDALTRTTALAAAGAEVLPAGTIPFAMDVLALPSGGLLVNDAAGPGAGRVLRVTLGPPAAANFATGLDFLGGVALAADGRVLVANVDGSFVGAVVAYDQTGAPLGTVKGGLSGALGVAEDGDGDVLVSGGFTGDFSSSTVIAIAPDATVSERAHGFGFSGEMFFDAARDELLVLDFGVTHVTAICRDQDDDGICDADDGCPGVADPGQTDADGDGLGDACDPCTGVAVAKAKVTVGKLATPPGDETLAFSGELTLPFPYAPALDPVTAGIRVVVADGGGVVLDATVPGGAFDAGTETGWEVSAKNGSFKYTNPTGTAGGIVRARVAPSTKTPGLVKFSVRGKKRTYAVDTGALPLAATFVLDAAAGQCGDATFPGPAPLPSCAFDPAKGKGRVRCK